MDRDLKGLRKYFTDKDLKDLRSEFNRVKTAFVNVADQMGRLSERIKNLEDKISNLDTQQAPSEKVSDAIRPEQATYTTKETFDKSPPPKPELEKKAQTSIPVQSPIPEALTKIPPPQPIPEPLSKEKLVTSTPSPPPQSTPLTSNRPPPIPSQETNKDKKDEKTDGVIGMAQCIMDQLSDQVPIGGRTKDNGSEVSKPKRLKWDAEGIESLIGENFLNKLGVSITVIGLALAMGYGFKHLGPMGKILTGVVLAISGIGAGVYFEPRERWRLYARGLIGGGWALLYFTTYASFHIESVRVISSSASGMILLFSVAIGIIAHSLKYRSQTVTGLAYVLGFFTLTLTEMQSFSLVATGALAISLVIIQWRLKWHFLGSLGVAAVYLNFTLWLHPIARILQSHVGPIEAFEWPAAILVIYWLTFTSSHFLVREDRRIEASIMVANAGAFYVLFRALMRLTGHIEDEWVLSAGLGTAYLIVLSMGWFSSRILMQHIAAGFAALLIIVAIPQKLSGPAVTTGWVTTGLVAYFGAFLWKRKWYTLIGFAYFMAAITHLFMIDLRDLVVLDAGGIFYYKHMPATVFGIITLCLSGYLLHYWSYKHEDDHGEIIFFQSSLLFLVGTGLAMALFYADLVKGAYLAGWAGLVPVLVWGGVILNRVDLRSFAYIVSIITLGPYVLDPSVTYGLIIALALLSADRVNGWRIVDESELQGLKTGAAVLVAMITLCIMALIEHYYHNTTPFMTGFGWACIGFISYIWGLVSKEARYRVAAYFILFMAIISIPVWDDLTYNSLIAAICLVSYLISQVNKIPDRVYDVELKGRWTIAAGAATAAVIVCFNNVYTEYLPLSWAAISIAVLTFGLFFKDYMLRLCSYGLMAITTSIILSMANLSFVNTFVALTAVAAYLVSYCKPIREKLEPDELKNRWSMVLLSAIVACYLAREWSDLRYITLVWAGIGFLTMAISMLFSDNIVRFISYTIVVICSLRITFMPAHIGPENLIFPTTLVFAYIVFRTRWAKNKLLEFEGNFLWLLMVITGISASVVFSRWFDQMYVTASWAGIALLIFSFGLIYKDLMARFFAYALLGLCVFKVGLIDQYSPYGNLIFALLLTTLYISSHIHLISDRLEEIEQKYKWGLVIASGLVACIVFARWVESGYLTVAWAGVSLFVMGIGMVFRDRPIRFFALGLFGLCVLKVFIMDLRGLDTFSRILSFVGLGVMLLISSYVYTRYRDSIQKYL